MGLFVFGCDSIVSQQPVAEEGFSAERTIQGSAVMENENLPCQIQCIDPEAPEYVHVDEEWQACDLWTAGLKVTGGIVPWAKNFLHEVDDAQKRETPNQKQEGRIPGMG